MTGFGFDMNLDSRGARESDIPGLVNLLADDALGAAMEDISATLNQCYLEASHSIEQDPNNELTVVEFNGQMVGMLLARRAELSNRTGKR